MEFGGGDHLRHHRDVDEEEEAGSEEILMMETNNNIGGTNLNNHHTVNSNSNLSRVKMVEALSQVQIHQPNPTPPPLPTASSGNTTKPRYRECLRNHAINVMGHALDGCGEFMPGGPQGSVEALKCAACSCHRNFHRKEDPTDHHHQTTGVIYSHYRHQQSGGPFAPYYRTTAPSGYLHLGPRPLALPSASGGGGSQSGGEEEEDVSDPVDGGARYNGGSMMMMRNGAAAGENNKKRFRTKFTAEQKERMLVMAERIGWRIQKCDEDLVQQFCHESNVKRHVFKVWMHNNKHTLGKSTTITTTTTTSSNLNINSINSSSSRQQHIADELIDGDDN